MADDVINITTPTQEAQRLWAKAVELAEAFGADESWTLIGGLMVQLHGFERGSPGRPTEDIDVLGDSRQRPSMTVKISKVLAERGGEIAMPPVGAEDLGYKFEIDGEIVEVLGSEGVRGDPMTVGKYTTFKVPGGTQALRRTEVVEVSVAGGPATKIRRPSLLGAILIKARVVAKKRKKFESDRQDTIRLLGYVQDARSIAETEALKKSERKWLHEIEGLLDFDDASLLNLFPEADIGRARQAFQLLTQD